MNPNISQDHTSQIEDDLLCHEDFDVGKPENLVQPRQDHSEPSLREEPLTEYEIRLFRLTKAMNAHLGKITSSINNQPAEKQ